MSNLITRQEVELLLAKAQAGYEARIADLEKRVAERYLKIARAPRPIKIFALDGSKEYGRKVANHLGLELTPHDEKEFDDGECYAKPTSESEGNVRGHNVFVIQSLFSDAKESVADKMMKLCIMCGACEQASAHEVVAVIPHLAWARQDRKTQSREPITTKIVARMLESTKIARALLMDVHNLAAEQNAFDIPIDNLEGKKLFAEWCTERLDPEVPIVVLTPDAGGLSRADRFRVTLMKLLKNKHQKSINVGIAVYDKLRRPTGELSGGNIVGDVKGAQTILLDDMVSTAGTATQAGLKVHEFGGKLFAICATHGLFVGKANSKLSQLDCPIVVADTVDAFRLNEENRKKVHIVDTTKITADAIHRIHTGTGSISELLS